MSTEAQLRLEPRLTFAARQVACCESFGKASWEGVVHCSKQAQSTESRTLLLLRALGR